MKVMIFDGVSTDGLNVLKDAGVEYVEMPKMTEEEIIAVVDTYDAIMVRSATKITRKIMEAGHNLKILGRAGVGVDNIDVAAATEKGIIVVNSPGGNTIAAAEHTIAMLMSIARMVPQAHAKLVKGEWDKKSFTGVELRNKVMGVVGLGKIGAHVAKVTRGMEMRVIAYDPFISQEKAKSLGIEMKSFDEVIKEADFITVHLPLTSETRNLIGTKQFEQMKKGVRIINVARGGIINENDLYKALESGKIAGAAIDVFEKEPTLDSSLFKLPNIVVTPHLGASTEEAQVNVAIDVAEEIVRVAKGELVRNAVNVPSINPEVFALVGPYLPLVKKMGNFLGQIISGNLEEVEIRYNGSLAGYNLLTLTNTFLTGLLKPILEEGVNFINAPVIAKERGIKVRETKTEEMEDFANLITAYITTDNETRSVAGTLFRNDEARFVRVDDYTVDIVPQGHMLFVPHLDKPKIIGRVGTMIGEHDVNIAGMVVGRKVVGGKAVMVLQIDNVVPEGTMEDINKIDGVLDVKYVYLD